MSPAGAPGSEPLRLEAVIYFDVVCPDVARLSRLLEAAERAGAEVEDDWRPFSLEQVNAPAGDLPVWERPERSREGAIHALAAHEWVRAEAPYALGAFRRALLFLHHEEGAPLADWDTYHHAAAMAGLEGDHLVWAVRDEGAGYAEVGRRHEEARRTEVFGVPTLVRAGRTPLFVKLAEQVEEADPTGVLGLVWSVLEAAEVLELKRPWV